MNAWWMDFELAIISFMGERAAVSHRRLIQGHVGGNLMTPAPTHLGINNHQDGWSRVLKGNKPGCRPTGGKKQTQLTFPLQIYLFKKSTASFTELVSLF